MRPYNISLEEFNKMVCEGTISSERHVDKLETNVIKFPCGNVLSEARNFHILNLYEE